MNKPNNNLLKDGVLLVILIILSFIYNYVSAFYGSSVSQIHIFHLLSYRVNEVLFPFVNSLVVNPDLKGIPLCPANVIFLPPGMHIMLKLISMLFSRSHTATNSVLLLIQLFNITLIYLTLRKITGRFFSFALTMFMIFIFSVYLVNDSFIQPLLILVIFTLMWNVKKSNLITYLICGIITGLTWVFRQNVGLFLSASIVGWIFVSNIADSQQPLRYSRGSLCIFLFSALVGGIIVFRTLNNIDDKIWYLLPYYVFFSSLSIVFIRNKNLCVNIKITVKELGTYLLPNIFLILIWISYFGRTIGFSKYLYNIFIVPFKHISVYEYSYLFHFKVGINSFFDEISKGGFNSLVSGFYSMFRWTGTFSIVFVINIFIAIYISYQLLKKREINLVDIKIALLSIVGILMCYPIESYWILVSKFIFFIIAFAYFFQKICLEKKRMIITVGILFLLLSLPHIGGKVFEVIKGKTSSFEIVNERADLRLPPEKASELRKVIKLIKDTVNDQKYYVVDGFTDMEMLYNLTYYHHRNYYIFLRGDCMNPESIKDFILRLNDYPYILVNQKD